MSIYEWYMKKKGYDANAASWFKSSFKKDLKNKKVKLSQKIWCWRRGFLSNKISYYGINEKNYQEYVSDLEFYRLFPLNNRYSKLIDDKLTLKYTLQPFNEYLPEYYYILRKNKVQKIFDCPIKEENTTQAVRNLLRDKKKLAVKLIEGEKGKGFYKFEEKENAIYVNDKLYKEEDFLDFISQLNGYLVTEYIEGNANLERIYSHSLNTVRVMYIRDEGDPFKNWQ